MRRVSTRHSGRPYYLRQPPSFRTRGVVCKVEGDNPAQPVTNRSLLVIHLIHPQQLVANCLAFDEFPVADYRRCKETADGNRDAQIPGDGSALSFLGWRAEASHVRLPTSSF